MGCSSSATLFWGLCGSEEGEWCNLGKNYDDPDYIEPEDADELAEWEDVYVKRMGLPEEGEESNGHWEKRRKLIQASGCTISSYGIHDCDVPIIAVQDSVVESWDCSGAVVDMDNLHDAGRTTLMATGELAWFKQLKAFCQVMNIKWSDPKWWLVSSYG